ncbi:MAG: ComF family protein [Clostridia bacterium]|nr:ComF family protein [Clostridia bacterium]
MILKNLFSPPKCILCEKVLPLNQHLPNICSKCISKLPLLPTRTCARCGKPLDIAHDKPFCPFCLKQHPGLSAVVSPFLYKTEMRESILRFKFRNHPGYSKSYAHYMAERLQAYKLTHFDAIVPVPISKKRFKERGYNQSYLLAKELSELLNIPVENLLIKTIDTPRQSTLSKKERAEMPKKAFAFAGSTVLPHTVLLIDDIFTTGATVSACSSVLRKAGIPKVYVSTLAVHLPDIYN